MSIENIICIPPIPVDNIPSPWRETFQQLNQVPPPLPVCNFPDQTNEQMPDTAGKEIIYWVDIDKSGLKPRMSILPTLVEVCFSDGELPNYTLKLTLLDQPALQCHADMLDADWRIALYWIVKKQWDSDLIIPTSTELAQLYEPWAELLNQVLKLCTVCFDRKNYLSRHYLHAADWFLKIIQEAKQIDTEIMIENEAKGKDSTIKTKREIISQLRELNNSATLETSPHYYRLIKVALSMEKCDEFNKNYWKPFLSAGCKDIQGMERKTSQESFVVNHKIVYRAPGQGKGIYTLINLNHAKFR
ncbi:hypothetical protein ACN23B_07315 [Anabaena sp. FACHB-709]|uniref:Uncharacterized protein n=2 Tax=Nostocaceae TaxID=1162 RepID=A0A1Z4KTV0_ANAVA|nr:MULTISPECIES: hypothetical protein [Nostocaceae]BAY72441.1 hypothetical protein NIES23_52660 [Trichormus variabilis NIES-23]HBW32865.1 hypothetical protein [Nostoc sp. UBA8866]MBD2170824.1 hypothetical protein [Anabaena cylindrica FACHB-318]MBD2262609.1 hypothetical protein [Anabaena sp. FACHB-709]MBD2272156.1 hypothetical protein [Nostoc sp. PCC 7120 = FACHB-418]